MPTEHHAYNGPLQVDYVYEEDCACRGTGDHTGLDYTCGIWVIDPIEPDTDQLAEMLRGHARGEYAWEAAVELLVAHGRWLPDPAFRRYINIFLAYTRPGGPDTPRAIVQWPELADALERGELTGSGSELGVLQLACSLASIDARVSLRTVLSSLDERNAYLVVCAVAHATGQQMRSL